MTNKFNEILEEFETLSIEEQEAIVEIEQKRLIEKKRKSIIEEVREAEKEYAAGKLKPESVDEIMRQIKNEANKNR